MTSGYAVLWVVSVTAAAVPLVLVAMGGGCASTTASFATDCTNYTPDSGVGPNTDCAIGWSCNSGSALFEMICNADSEPGLYDCTCSDGVAPAPAPARPVDTFVCTGAGALSTANMFCQFNIQQ